MKMYHLLEFWKKKSSLAPSALAIIPYWNFKSSQIACHNLFKFQQLSLSVGWSLWFSTTFGKQCMLKIEKEQFSYDSDIYDTLYLENEKPLYYANSYLSQIRTFCHLVRICPCIFVTNTERYEFVCIWYEYAWTN